MDKEQVDLAVKLIGEKSNFDPKRQCNWCLRNKSDLKDCELCGHYCGYKICQECLDTPSDDDDDSNIICGQPILQSLKDKILAFYENKRN